MRIITRKTLLSFWTKHPLAEQPLKAWFDEAKNDVWGSPNDIKYHYKSASIIDAKRVVFNIKGNDYRLVTDIEYHLGIIFIVWIGTHAEYDKLNIKKLKYD